VFLDHSSKSKTTYIFNYLVIIYNKECLVGEGIFLHGKSEVVTLICEGIKLVSPIKIVSLQNFISFGLKERGLCIDSSCMQKSSNSQLFSKSELKKGLSFYVYLLL